MTTPLFIPSATVQDQAITPYISPADYINSATGVDVDALVITDDGVADAQANLVALALIIRRASGWANNICFQTLAATLDTQTATNVYVRRDGSIYVSNKYWPLLEVDTFEVGCTPSTLAAITNAADMWLEGRKTLIVPTNATPGTRVQAQWTYWNGWFCNILEASVAQGATSLQYNTYAPPSLAGQDIWIYDGEFTENISVPTSFTGGATIPLVNATTYAHTLSTTAVNGFPQYICVSNLPEDVRQAIVSLTSALIKVRGIQAMVVENDGQTPTKDQLIEAGGLEDFQVAEKLLARYSRNT